jgi:PA domain
MSVDRTPLAVKALCTAALLGSAWLTQDASAAANIIVNFNNTGNVGYNDPTPATPVGGNPGLTLGEQRRIATQHAANLWAATLDSNATIYISAQFTAQACTELSATLGSAGPTTYGRDFPNAPFPNTWYHVAQRNKLAGSEATPGANQLSINFNVNLGTPGCLSASPWYFGIDNNPPPSAINLVVVLLHEFGHGLGFTVGPTNGQTGARNSGSPSIWERFMVDNQTGLSWFEMTSNAQRAASAIGVDRLVWNGPIVNAAVPTVLAQGIATASIGGPAVRQPRVVNVGEASFGPPIVNPFTAEVGPVVDQADGVTGLACEPLSPANARAVVGKIALVDRGLCNNIVKTTNLQAAGAIGMLLADNVASLLPPNVGGVNPAATIISASVRQVDAVFIKEQLKRRSRSSTGVFVTLSRTGTQYAGADAQGRIKLYTPSPYQGGSSVSHFDVTAFRHQLMEPAINGNLTQSVIPPQDLTFRLFQDIGW